MSIAFATFVFVVAYLLLLKWVAYAAHKSSEQTAEDYFVVNRSLNKWMIVGTVIATMVNTLAVTGVPALVYQGGILFAQMYVIGLIAPSMIYLFGPKIWAIGKSKSIFTQAELYGDFYKSKVVLFATATIGLLAIFPFATIQVSAVGKIFSGITAGAISYDASILVLGISIGLYLFFGGSRAVVWTDLVQGLTFLFIIIFSASLFTYWTGGYPLALEKLQTAIPEKLVFNKNNGKLF